MKTLDGELAYLASWSNWLRNTFVGLQNTGYGIIRGSYGIIWRLRKKCKKVMEYCLYGVGDWTGDWDCGLGTGTADLVIHDTGKSVPGRKVSCVMIAASYKRSAARAGTTSTIQRHTTFSHCITTTTSATRLFCTVLLSKKALRRCIFFMESRAVALMRWAVGG